jgi:GT2 family glycosyltransferase
MLKNKLAVDIVIPVHNSAHWLDLCLEEVLKYKPSNLGSIVVVDNASEASQRELIANIVANYKSTKLFIFDNEQGFGQACNFGSQQGTSENILFLNTDCLVTKDTIQKLSDTIDQDQSIVLACPLSNNSPNYSYPMFAGRSYIDMAEIISSAFRNEENIQDAATIVGCCLMVRRNFFESLNGFDPIWSIGYGEESDLHMKALEKGKRGVVNLSCYVYHLGGGSFKPHIDLLETLKNNNQKLFNHRWGKSYRKLIHSASPKEALDKVSLNISKKTLKNYQINLDVLFVLPGISQHIGGIHAVISICNYLIRNGIKASVALVGAMANEGIKDYQEPVFFNFLYYPTDDAFLRDDTVLPKIIFSTILTSAPLVAKFAKARKAMPIQFIQGYEAYFENGLRYDEAIKSYKTTNHLVTTSQWLVEKIGRHLLPNKQIITKLPIIINKSIFYTSKQKRDIDLVCIVREAPDKGQWLLMETIHKLSMRHLKLLIIYSTSYPYLENLYKDNSNVECIKLPLSQYEFAKELRRSKVYLDLSLHEGYGLLPIEAAMSGCRVVSLDSGGNREYKEKFSIKFTEFDLDVDSIIKDVLEEIKKYKQIKKPTYINHDERKNWVSFIEKLKKSINPVPYKAAKINLNYSEQLTSKKLKAGIHIEEFAIKMYQKIRPYIPHKIHLIIKIFYKGQL